MELYDGDFKGGKRNGKGKLMCANGDVYDGDWRDDKRNGKGKYTWADGDVYDGEWRDDNQHGNGKRKMLRSTANVLQMRDLIQLKRSRN